MTATDHQYDELYTLIDSFAIPTRFYGPFTDYLKTGKLRGTEFVMRCSFDSQFNQCVTAINTHFGLAPPVTKEGFQFKSIDLGTSDE